MNDTDPFALFALPAWIYGGLTPGQRATLAGRGEKRGAGDAA